MNKVTDFKKLKNNTYLITINNKQTHILSEETIVKHHVLLDSDFDDKTWKKISSENDDLLLYQKAVHFIDYQMRSISEVKKHLRKHHAREQVIDSIIQKLKNQNYVNDNLFTKEYITEKMEYDLVGPRWIKEKLIQKGIHFDLIDQHLAVFTKEKEAEKILLLLQKELKYKIKKPYIKAYQSLKSKLVNKGFSLDEIESIMLSYKEDIKAQCMDSELLERDLEKLLAKYDIEDYEQRNKVIQKLRQKGYDFQLIQKFMS